MYLFKTSVSLSIYLSKLGSLSFNSLIEEKCFMLYAFELNLTSFSLGRGRYIGIYGIYIFRSLLSLPGPPRFSLGKVFFG